MNKVKEFNFDMQRENWIDWAKALGILLVVMGHSVYASKDVTSFIFVIHMPLFFFVSGYLFKTSRSWYEISISNVKTLLIPYIGFNIIGFSYYLAICIAKICISGGRLESIHNKPTVAHNLWISKRHLCWSNMVPACAYMV